MNTCDNCGGLQGRVALNGEYLCFCGARPRQSEYIGFGSTSEDVLHVTYGNDCVPFRACVHGTYMDPADNRDNHTRFYLFRADETFEEVTQEECVAEYNKVLAIYGDTYIGYAPFPRDTDLRNIRASLLDCWYFNFDADVDDRDIEAEHDEQQFVLWKMNGEYTVATKDQVLTAHRAYHNRSEPPAAHVTLPVYSPGTRQWTQWAVLTRFSDRPLHELPSIAAAKRTEARPLREAAQYALTDAVFYALYDDEDNYVICTRPELWYLAEKVRSAT